MIRPVELFLEQKPIYETMPTVRCDSLDENGFVFDRRTYPLNSRKLRNELKHRKRRDLDESRWIDGILRFKTSYGYIQTEIVS